jgi:hypothetical protein
MPEEKQDAKENTKKEKPAYYIFTRDGDEKTINVGAAFNQKSGRGLNIVIEGKRYEAYPPKVSPSNG